MKFSRNINIDLDLDGLYEQYWNEFGSKLDNLDKEPDDRIFPIQSGFLVTAKRVNWNEHIIEDALGIKIETARVFVTNAGSILNMHRDCVGKTQQLRQWAINIPLANCDRGPNQWFSDEDNEFGEEIFYSDGAAVVPKAGTLGWNVTEEHLLDTVKLIRTDVYHSCYNKDNPNRRVILSMRGDINITWDEMVARVEKYNNRNK